MCLCICHCMCVHVLHRQTTVAEDKDGSRVKAHFGGDPGSAYEPQIQLSLPLRQKFVAGLRSSICHPVFLTPHKLHCCQQVNFKNVRMGEVT